jgi:hypothetical protein
MASAQPLPQPTQPTAYLPTLWFGFAIAGLLLVVEAGEAMLQHAETTTLLFLLLWIGGITYWMVCVYQIHKVLAAAGAGASVASPGKAAGFHFIPFYNFHWIFHWPNQIARYLNARAGSVQMPVGWPGFVLLVGFVLKAFDGGLALMVMFGVLVYVQRKIAAALPGAAPA